MFGCVLKSFLYNEKNLIGFKNNGMDNNYEKISNVII